MNNKKKEKKIIIILVVLLALSIALLVLLFVNSDRATAHTEIKDNNINTENICKNYNKESYSGSIRTGLIGKIGLETFYHAYLTESRRATADDELKIYFNHASDSSPMWVDNMFPGDVVTKTYKVDVYHNGEVTVDFTTNIRTGYEKLAEVLMCRVTLKDYGSKGEAVVLYDGLMSGLSEKVSAVIDTEGKRDDELVFVIDVYLEESVGNEYQNKSLYADFEWVVNDEGHLIPPTGDSVKIIILCGAVVILGFILFIFVRRKRKNEEET